MLYKKLYVYFISCLVFWNADKPIYQKKMAEKLSDVFFNDQINFDLESEYLWMKCFFVEFVKKWPKIDFLRMDKYIMLTGVIVKKFFNINLQNQNFEQNLKIYDIIILIIKSGNYNFSFVSIILKLISQFIDEIFKVDVDTEVKHKFLEGYFLEFFEKLIKVKNKFKKS